MKNLYIRTDEQAQWMEQIEKHKEEFLSEAQIADKQAIFPKKGAAILKKLGYPLITVPKKYGGQGLGTYDMVLIQETIAALDENLSLSLGWTLGVLGELYEKNLWEKEKLETFAEKTNKGIYINRAVSEAITGSPTRGGRPGTQAVRTETGWILNGRKTFTTASPVLDYYLVSAWIEEFKKVGFFLIPHHQQGLSLENTWNVMAMRGTRSDDLVLTDVKLQEEALVELPNHPRGKGINGWLLHIPANYLGIAQAARDYALHFASTYQPNSIQTVIAELPNVQHLLGEIELELEKARLVLYGVAAAYDDKNRRPLLTNEISVAKHTVTNAAINIVDKAMRVVGAKSLQLSNPLQRYYRNVRAGLHNPPMDDMTIQKLAITALQE
ncbi:alkylation response protein AidB-like acyl-CoA dehydrogenase [Oikeobacillus pervagus]|uniref:Alkylation response protein AidB-like acyl-CoA dehydrogenase n=1 Tax=Oikeobacillus pervagus TaxID=1325931 RepID=A0AAJ1WGI9_9BACI|nr:acyl-CoA dehydrogenase family protein [Oikeobacillus pervagus]MDQ0215117.1 alkylation response protein AidB-like acyl-CoA dehydrogenase [Oikeobacillus pervagus]